jgi:hypothetical protein
MRLPFGRYRGTPLEDVPDHYIAWLLTVEIRSPQLRAAIEDEARARELADDDGADAAAPPPWALLESETAKAARAMVALGFRAAARRAHPDVGGSTTAMQAVTAARTALLRFLEQREQSAP